MIGVLLVMDITANLALPFNESTSANLRCSLTRRPCAPGIMHFSPWWRATRRLHLTTLKFHCPQLRLGRSLSPSPAAGSLGLGRRRRQKGVAKLHPGSNMFELCKPSNVLRMLPQSNRCRSSPARVEEQAGRRATHTRCTALILGDGSESEVIPVFLRMMFLMVFASESL